MTFYLVTTDHLEASIWFRNQDDFKAAMNAIPLIAYAHGVIVLAFILMSNHVHFVLQCTYEQALAFINEFKRHCSYYLSRKYHIRETLKNNHVDIQELDFYEESLERAIAYVQMNSVAANICIHPNGYPWGTGDCFFNVNSHKGIPLESLSERARFRLLHSKMSPPGGLLIGEEGYILPESYVRTKFVESLYRTPKRMLVFLNQSSKAKTVINSSDSLIPSFKDQDILPMVEDLCRVLFKKKSIEELNPEQQTEILRQMRYRFSSNINQMSRVTRLPYETVAKLLDSL
ncbi:MAG: hypothetical protein J5490_02505 [Bacteroidales bacterium]|nr:hypothetical protein [Bacteroidales bacterium]